MCYFYTLLFFGVCRCTFCCKTCGQRNIVKEREAKKALEQEKAKEKERKKIEAAAAQAAKDAQKKVNPKEMFLNETDKYSAFDDNVNLFFFVLLDFFFYIFPF